MCWLISFMSGCITIGRAVMLVALLTDGFAGTKDGEMSSSGAVETQTFVEKNLSAIGHVSLLYIRRLCDLCRSKHKANSRVLNQCHDMCGKFLLAGVRSVLLMSVLAHVPAGLYPPDSSRSTIKLLLKVLRSPSFPSRGPS